MSVHQGTVELSQGKWTPSSLAVRAAWLFWGAVFASAFLLFQVQPLISKAILPWFGGTPGVWTTCMLFFQVVLFAGYAYAHLVCSRLPVRLQGLTHASLLLLTLALLNVLPSPDWKPQGDESPVLRILLVLSVTVGLPYFLLSTTGPLLQRWYSLAHPGRSPYRLYALSNVGSLLALLSYPFVVEPLASMRTQGQLWQWGFWVFAGLCGACIALLVRQPSPAGVTAKQPGTGDAADLSASPPSSDLQGDADPMVSTGNSTSGAVTGAQPSATVAARPSGSLMLMWFGLALVGSAMLLATTNQVCLDVAVVPFLWVAPLSLYLLSFILCFDSDRWYVRPLWAAATALLVVAVCWMLVYGYNTFLPLQVAAYFGAMFAACMVCHGELARLRPAPEHLTAFYLTIAAGGASGGLFVALAAPLLFPDYWEFHLCLAAVSFIAILSYMHSRGWLGADARPPLIWTVIAILLISLVGTVFAERLTEHSWGIAVARNFYGVLRAEPDTRGGVEMLLLRNGRILHGLQFRREDWRNVPTTYYSTTSGVGRAATLLSERQRPLRIGVVGLGVGTMAAYGRPGDVVRFYEINDAVVKMARQQFTFLADSPADVQIVLGDARLSLETESPQDYDLIVLDAFSSDAIPTHLLTREAMVQYMRHLRPDGIIAVHISNLHFDLDPVVAALVDEFGLVSALVIDFVGVERLGDRSSQWMLLARDPAVLDHESLKDAERELPARRVLWTDDFSNLFQVLKD